MKSFCSDTRATVASKPRAQVSPAKSAGLRMVPLAHAIAVMLMTAGMADAAHAQRAFSPAWFGAMGATQNTVTNTGVLPNGKPASTLTNPLAQQQQAAAQLQHSINNLNLTARVIAAQQAAQAAARQTVDDASVPDGLADGGLKVDTHSLTAGWINAKQDPTQTVAGGKTTVKIEQTADKAILNWETFNIGKNTTVQFDQQPDWAVLNRVNDPAARPSQIQGQIKADGTVMIVNRNGIVFSGSSQVDTRNLVAAAASIVDSQFTSNGLYSPDGSLPSFADAFGKVMVEAGAQITTREPSSVTLGGGYVLLMGREVDNAGQITTRKGQTELAAGDSFVIRKGLGTDANTASTTRGNEISPRFNADSTAGTVSNTGLILAREGDITLAGHDVRQDGAAVATTTVNTRGTIHLLNSASDTSGQVTLGKDAVTAVVIEDDGTTTALDSQRDALIKDSAAQDLLRGGPLGAVFDNLSNLSDRRDLSRIEIVSGGDVNFAGDSLTLATGGQIAVSAGHRSFVADQAQLDVSGSVGVNVAMESNNVLVNVQGNELRDSPLNRDSGNLFNNNVWIDRRQLVLVPAGTDGYDSDRWYAAGGLLEVGGYLSNQGHGIGEWAAQGGTITLGGSEVITQAGSMLNLSGGSLNVQTGYIYQTWLKGSDGKLYRLNEAPADMVFEGVYKGFEDEHVRWGTGTTEYYYNSLIAPQKLLENGYTVGRDAGKVIVSAPTAVLEGDIDARVFNGPQQTRVRDALDDGYRQAQNAAAQAGTLALVGPWLAEAADWVQHFDTDVRFGEFEQTTRNMAASDALAADRIGTLWLDSAHLGAQHLGGLDIATLGDIAVDKAIAVEPGGTIRLKGKVIDIGADLVARGGTVDVLADGLESGEPGSLVLHGGATIDTRGLWTNERLDPTDSSGLAYVDGGDVTLHASGDVTLEAGSLIDTSAGGAILDGGGTRGGAGGDIVLSSSMRDLSGNGGSGMLTMDGDLRAYGFTKGGRLTLVTDGIVVIDNPAFDLGTNLPAGTVLPLDVTLTDGIVIPAGTPIPIAYTQTITRIEPGAVLTFPVELEMYQPLGADWVVPSSFQYLSWTIPGVASGFAYAGSTVVKGASFYSAVGSLQPGYTLPADAFPNGIHLPSPKTVNYAAGSILTTDLSLAAGTVLPRGTELHTAISIKEIARLNLTSDLFDKGFSAYTLNGQQGLLVGGDARIEPVMPLLRFTDESEQVATGNDPYGTLELSLAPIYSEDAAKARLTQRAGVDLALYSGVESTSNPGVMAGGWVDIAQGAVIQVDPGRSVDIASGGQVSIDGTISARGGSISVVNQGPLGGAFGGYAADPGALSVWIGEHATLDVSAQAYTALAADGRRYGVLPDGGTIVLGSEGGVDSVTKGLRSTDAAVVIRPGARLDASGDSAIFDAADGRGLDGSGSTPYTIASDGGSISVSSYNALYLDGEFRAAAGGEGAAGGTLSLALESPVYPIPRGEPGYVPVNLRAGRVITVGQDYVPSGLAADLSPGALDPAWTVGQARIGAEQIAAGGFDTVSLWGRNGIAFDGDVDLSVGRSLILQQGPIYNTLAGGQVRLAAPYLFLDGATTLHQIVDSYLPDVLPDYPSGGTLTASADLIDVRNTAQIFYDDTKLSSRGDLRFLASTDEPLGGLPTTRLKVAAGHLDLAAQQLYPATNAIAEVSAGISLSTDGNNTVTFAPDSDVSIESIDGTTPALPASVFGSLSIMAPVVRQGGIVRAPLGAIVLGQPGSSANESLTELLPGSLTSVSAAGLVMPYGGTTDGVSYTVDGSEVLPFNLIDGKFAQPGRFDMQGITLNGTRIVSDEGSRLDLSGGGTLTGAAFISGRGGSVDALLNPLTPGGKVYAIMPGVATTPTAGGAADAWKGDIPGVGEQITIGAGVPGLPGGTYTLLPANYALLPGAYRVELGAQSLVPQALPALLLQNGSYALGGVRGVAHTAILDTSTTAVTITPGSVLRTYSQYNEQSYDDFQIAQAATAGTLRPLLAADAKSLTLGLNALPAASEPTRVPALVFDGSADFGTAPGGYAGSLLLQVDPNSFGAEIVITGPGSVTPRSGTVTTVPASALAAVGAPSLYIGSKPIVTPNSSSLAFGRNVESIRLEDGAVLRGAQVVLSSYGLITLESGARIDTLGQEGKLLDSSAGYLFGNDPTPYPAAGFLIASNGQIALNSPSGVSDSAIVIADGASIYSEGTIGFYADKGVSFEGTPLLGTRNLALSLPSINIGEAGALAAAQRAGTLPAGLDLDQGLLDRLVAGSRADGVPALEKLTLGATQSINFYGAVDLNLVDAATGEPLLQQLVLNTPAIYGSGGAGDTARLTVDTLVWNGKASPVVTNGSNLSYESARPGAVIPGGPGTGSGTLDIDARDIVFGYPEASQPIAGLTFNRLMLGFSNANLHASDRITANGTGSLSVYAGAGADPSVGFDPAAYRGIGGALNLVTPLLTGDAASVMSYYVGGPLTLGAPAGAVGNNATQAALGAEINLHADSIAVSSAIALPSGRLTMTAVNDITLAEGSNLDLAGQAIEFFDVTKYSWGGDVALESAHGNIVQAPGSTIDLSAQGSDAGTLDLTATDANAGQVLLQGTLKGQGGVDYAGGSIALRAQRIGASAANLSSDFAALNVAMNGGGFVGARSFDVKQGDLRIGDEVHAREVDISVDGGSLQVDGRIDASGIRPGSIRLAARDDLTLAAGAVLDVHGSSLQVDSYGEAIEAKNRGMIELNTSQGWLTLSPGVTLDLSSPDGTARGRVELNAGRTGETSGDVRISASGPVGIRGAGSVAVSGFWSYSPTDIDGTVVQDNGGTEVVAADGSVGLNQIDQRSRQFMDAALANGDLRGRLVGLSAYGDAFHLQPGVEINTKDTPSGNLTVKGDLDLSGYRYGENADRDPGSATYGAGEAGSFLLRAAGNLTINGSINDGFSPPADSDYRRLTVIAAGTPLTTTLQPDNAITLTADWVVPPGGSTYDYPYASFFYSEGMTVPAGTTLYPGFTVIPAGSAFPQDIQLFESGQGKIWALAPMQSAGSQSWSLRLVGGADLAAVDTRTLRAATTLAGAGNIRLSDGHADVSSDALIPSVIRTGTGDLELLAAGDFAQTTPFGIYTAGTQSPLAAGNGDYNTQGTYYPDHGGNLRVVTQGNLTTVNGDAFVGNWLWHQGSNEDGIKTAWSINFGSYATDQFDDTSLRAFSGFGALGGGNVTVLAGGDAGNLEGQSGRGLVVAVGSTGRVTSVSTSASGAVTGGTLAQTGGGDLTVRVGGRLNPASGTSDLGAFTALRGDISIDAGAIGTIPLQYGVLEADDPRTPDPYTAATFSVIGAQGGAVVVPGDGHVVLRTRGDLVMDGAGDATQMSYVANAPVRSWFTLWQPTTSIDLFSAGGNLTPKATVATSNATWLDGDNAFGLTMLPAQFQATAATGSIYYGGRTTFTLAPSAAGELELLAQDSIYGGADLNSAGQALEAARFAMSGADADPDSIPNPFKPAHPGNTSQRNFEQGFFVFEPNTVTSNLHEGDSDPIRVYAVDGDLVNVVLGVQRDFYLANGEAVHGYAGAKSVQARAGRDIVGFGNGYYPNTTDKMPSLIVNANATDVSIISAGRDMFHTNVLVAGPGTLEVSAGRNFYQGDNGSITSIGPIVEGDLRPGASIVVQAGVGPNGPDYSTLAARYLDPANLADSQLPLADQSGKVAKTYESELVDWLNQRYGFTGTTAEASAYFQKLAPEQQRIFLRQVYFAELRAGGREYNDPDSRRFGSYLRGREMIATLFPDTDANGNEIVRTGDITMFGGAGIHTDFGGDIQLLAPGGKIVVGVQGAVPPSTSGIVSQGDGDIQIFSEQSLLLGLSRIMTTFGGDILAWSEEGDINAGRGSKTTLVYTPPKREYDEMGNVKLSPDVPSTGAGIATLNPIPETPPGDVDLIAPLGTIDAGEAGIRVSGNVNLAALQVVNAANIQVQGKSTGLPVVATVNVGALTNASTAAAQATIAAQDVVQRERVAARQALPSIFTVRVLGFGNETLPVQPDTPVTGASKEPVSYNPLSAVRILGFGELPERARRQLTQQERNNLGL